MELARELIKKWDEIKHHFWSKESHRSPDDQTHVMSEEEKLDETLKESFPASDPPGHYSKSSEDRKTTTH